MENLYERIEMLGQQSGYENMTVLCKAASVSRAVMSELKSGRTNELSLKNASKFSKLLNISVDYLLGKEDRQTVDTNNGKTSEPQKEKPTLTEKDERDIARTLEAVMNDLDNSGDLMFDGDPMTDEARESIRAAMKLGLEAAKLKNKERFTPKKFRKE